MAINICQTLYDTTFGLVDITKWTGLETFLEDFKPLMEAFLFGSIVLLAFMIILGKQKQNHLLTSMLVFAVVTTSSTYLFSQVICGQSHLRMPYYLAMVRLNEQSW